MKRRIRMAFDEWNVYTRQEVRDAVFTALILNALRRLCREVAIACYAQTVNVLPLIATRDAGAMYVTPQYLVFKLYARGAGSKVLATSVASPHYYSRELGAPVPYVDAAAAAGDGTTYIYVVNGSPDEEALCRIRLRALTPRAASHSYLSGEDVRDRNTFDQPNNVQIREGMAKVEGQHVVG